MDDELEMVELLRKEHCLCPDATCNIHNDRTLRQRLPVKSYMRSSRCSVSYRSNQYVLDICARTLSNNTRAANPVPCVHASSKPLTLIHLFRLAEPFEIREVRLLRDVEGRFVGFTRVRELRVEDDVGEVGIVE